MERWLARKLALGFIIGAIGTVAGMILYILDAISKATGWF